jgi:hypothetical protein
MYLELNFTEIRRNEKKKLQCLTISLKSLQP